MVCANILTHDGCSLRWVAELRYLGYLLSELVLSGVRSIMPNALSLVRLTAYLDKSSATAEDGRPYESS